jgi:hypothetical protein
VFGRPAAPVSFSTAAENGGVHHGQGIPRASYIKRSVFIRLEADEQAK